MSRRREYLGLVASSLSVAAAGCLDNGSGADGTQPDSATPVGTDGGKTSTESQVSPDGIEAAELSESGDPERLEAVETFPSEGRSHVESGTDIDYERRPPLSGPHYTDTTDAGFYEETQPAGNLVHTLEHGAVVVYYDPTAINQEAGDDETAEASLREFAATHTSVWGSVIAVPNAEPAADYVLTAWRHRLYMDGYDANTVYAFLSEYLGRGPENSVR